MTSSSPPSTPGVSQWALFHPRAARAIARAAIWLKSILIWVSWTILLLATIEQLALGEPTSILVPLVAAGIAWGFTRRLHAPLADAKRRGVPYPC